MAGFAPLCTQIKICCMETVVPMPVPNSDWKYYDLILLFKAPKVRKLCFGFI